MPLTERDIKELHNSVDELISNRRIENKEVVCFGNNDPARESIKYLKEKGIEIKTILDNGVSKKHYWNDIELINPSEYEISNKTFILIASKYYMEIREQLINLGCSEKQIVETLKYSQFYNPSLSKSTFAEEWKGIYNGYKIYRQIRKQVGRNVRLYISPAPSVGDMYLILYFLRKKIQYEGENYSFVLNGKAATKVCNECGEKKYITTDNIRDLYAFVRFAGEEKTNCIILNERVNYLNNIQNVIGYKKYSNFSMFFKNILLNNEQKNYSCPLDFTAYECNIDFVKEYGLIRGRTVLLSPYSNFLLPIPISFWEKLVETLNEKGFKVFTNSSSEKEPAIKGSSPVMFDFRTTVEFVNTAGIFIGARSGLCDVISSTTGKMHIVYHIQQESPYVSSKDYYSLINMGLNNEATEYIYNENEGELLVDKILNNLV